MGVDTRRELGRVDPSFHNLTLDYEGSDEYIDFKMICFIPLSTAFEAVKMIRFSDRKVKLVGTLSEK